MKALVTGADGLLGSHAVRKLLAKNIEVRVFNQKGSDSPTLEGLDIEKIDGDLLDDGDGLKNAMDGVDYVFHIAAITNMWAPKDITWKVNYDGTVKIIDACLEKNVKRLIFVGSASSYEFGTIDQPANESAPFPKAYKDVPYMESKYAAMALVKKSVAERGLQAVTVCPTFMLGKYDWRPSSGELIRQFVLRKMRAVSPGGRNFAYAPDVADAMIAAMDKGTPGESYIGAGKNMTYLDFFTRVAPLVGLPAPTKVLPPFVVKAAGAAGSAYQAVTRKPVTLNYTMARLSTCGTYYSPAKAINELGMPQTDTDAAIRETVECLREYGHIPAKP